jgi:hypothetical protein
LPGGNNLWRHPTGEGRLPPCVEAFLETLAQDIGYGARLLARNLGFSTTVLLTLTLGIGATTAIFGLVDAVLLRRAFPGFRKAG